MNNLNILIVEDESLVALELSNSIENYRFNVVDYVTTPKIALEVFQKEEINLILMDINLGDKIDGIELYKSFNTSVPIIYITAYQDEATISKAIETDPIGYLIKPYNENELLALLKLASYKINKNTTKIRRSDSLLDIGEGYFFNLHENQLYLDDEYVKLSPKETLLLKLLIEARGNVVPFITIEEGIWQDRVPSESSVRTLIYRLRGKLQYKLITTEPHQGIKLALVKFL